MIDTDKYEGHSPAPWQVNAGHDYIDIDAGSIRIASVENVANAQLIADAPLLLAEVKRLQDALKEAVEVVKEMEGMAYAGADADKFANHALEFIGNVKEMIE